MTAKVVKLSNCMENTENVVNTQLTTEQALDANTTESAVIEEPKKPVQAGEKTDPALLLRSLQEERDKRKKLEELLEEERLLRSSVIPSDEEAFSDEGKLLERKIKEVEKELVDLKKENAKKDLLLSQPAIKEHLTEFEEYVELPENKGMNLRTAAKAFLTEKGLLDTPRKGLEKPTGGEKSQPSFGKMTAQEAENLRKTNFKKYQEMLIKGQLIIE